MKEQLSRLQDAKVEVEKELETTQKIAEAVSEKLNAEIVELKTNVDKFTNLYNDELDARQNLEISLQVSSDKNTHLSNELEDLRNQLSEALIKVSNLEENLSNAESALTEASQANEKLQSQKRKNFFS